jgi:hypothetical protein
VKEREREREGKKFTSSVVVLAFLPTFSAEKTLLSSDSGI